jgi:hypothetical protein
MSTARLLTVGMESREFFIPIAPLQLWASKVATAETFICWLSVLRPLVARHGLPIALRTGLYGPILRYQFGELPNRHPSATKQTLHLIIGDDCRILQAV